MTGRDREELASRIAAADRRSLIRMLKQMQCGFAMDFTDEYLDSISLERLRHIVMAAGLHDRDQTSSRA